MQVPSAARARAGILGRSVDAQPHHPRSRRALLSFLHGNYVPLKDLQRGDTSDPHGIVARASKRVGLAWADSLGGPWHRMDQPLLPTAPDTFYSFLTSNPAPTMHEDGQVTMLFKSRRYVSESQLAAYRCDAHSAMTIGIATANRPEGPYRAACDEPLFSHDRFGEIEDPYLWVA